jgi:hypothetical protein
LTISGPEPLAVAHKLDDFSCGKPSLDRWPKTRALSNQERGFTAASLIGGRALIVNAVDSEAAAFWTRRGFIPSKDDPLILFRSIADIAASLR